MPADTAPAAQPIRQVETRRRETRAAASRSERPRSTTTCFLPEPLAVPEFDRYLVTLRLSGEARFPFEHGGVLRGLLSAALDAHRLPPGLVPFACEAGRLRFAAGDRYRLGVTFVGADRALAEGLRDGLAQLGEERIDGPQPVLGGNFALEEMKCLDPPDLDRQFDAVGDEVDLVFCSPLRVERPAARKERGAGYLNEDCFPADWFLDRLWRRIFFVVHRRHAEGEDRKRRPPMPPELSARPGHLIWNDMPVRGTAAKGRPYTLGGVRGKVSFSGLDAPWRSVLVVGAHLHAGQNVHYGLGRYALGGEEDIASDPDGMLYLSPARSLLAEAATPAVLERARDHVMAGEDGTTSSPDLGRLARELASGAYDPPPLGGFVQPKDDGGVRPLAVPTLADRVAQRAAMEVLAPAIDTLLEDSSYAYRRGFSRQGAARAIERAWDAGFRYVLDADIRAFFDLVDWPLLFAKLRALYPLEPLRHLVERWVRAPVDFEGRRIERRRGLPQGSPVAPLLANLYLDAFDEAIEEAGFRLVRFADDFVVLNRDLEKAQRARSRVVEELAQLRRLELNADETAIRSMDDGFSYLGYLFCRSLVLEERDHEDDAESAPPRRLEPDDVPLGSWLAAVPLERIQELVEASPGEGAGRKRRRRIERVPLVEPGAGVGDLRRPLYVSSPDSKLYLRRGTVVAEPAGGEEMEIPISEISHVVLCGRTRATVPVLRGLARRGIPTFFCRPSGKLYATLGPHEDRWHLWLEQARFAADEDACRSFAAEVVAARLRNMAVLAVRFHWSEASTAAKEIRKLARGCENKSGLEALRGLEGRGSARFWSSLAATLEPEWGFTGRRRRPPRDPVNAMLSFGYTLLHHHVSTSLVAAGLNPRIGFFHQPRGRHHALASDLQEELRHLVEALVWTLVRRRQIRPERDFRSSPDGRYPCLLVSEARRTFIDAFEHRLVTEFTPPGSEERMTYREFIARQARQVEALVGARKQVYRPLVLKA